MDDNKLSVFTGNLLTEGQQEFEFKKMCLNCTFAKKDNDGKLVCGNNENMQKAMEKVYEAIKQVNGYTVTNMVVEPVPLKKPVNKCGLWELSDEVIDQLKSLFV